MIKLAIFDLDGTILYTLPDLCAAMNGAMRAMGTPSITLEQASAYIGGGIRKFSQRAMGTDENDPRLDSCVAAFKAYYKEHLADYTVPYEGAVRLIEELRAAGIKTAVLSNKYDEATKRLCDVFYPKLFDAVYGECDLCPRKPAPDGIFLICKQLGIPPEQTVYIGDSGVDYKVSVNANTSHIAVTWGYRSKDVLVKAGAVSFADSTSELYRKIIEL